MLLIDGFVLLLAVAAAVPSLWFFIECVLGALYRLKPPAAGASRGRRVAILMPAHNESAGIVRTIQALKPQLDELTQLWVVADNCSDDTARLAAACGAQVLERHDTTRRGKGFALAHGIEHLAQDPPEVVIIFDADCEISPGGIAHLADQAITTQVPAQADYLLGPAPQPSPKSMVSALAFLIKNRVRPRGLDALGFPCLLTGTGMAFPWAVLRQAPPTDDNLVEDMVMGLDLARMGLAPRICPHARVVSALPANDEAAAKQRERWEHGHLSTLITQAPSLVGRGLATGRLGLVGLALELAVPPLSLLVLMVLGVTLLGALAALAGASALPFWIGFASFAGIAVGVLAGWSACGRDLVRGKDLLAIPGYVLWKIPLYFGFFSGARQKAWVRTERAPGDAAKGVGERR